MFGRVQLLANSQRGSSHQPDILRQYAEQIVGSELRERLVGLTTTWVLLLVVYVMHGDVIRIISARMVTKTEREMYENQ